MSTYTSNPYGEQPEPLAGAYTPPGIESVEVIAAYDPGDSEMSEPEDEAEAYPGHPLDSEEARERLKKIEEWWLQARLAHSANRKEQAIDEAFRDGEQWSDEDREVLSERGQAPIVFNMLLPMVTWLSGTERKTRVDSRVLPRGEEDTDAAEVKTKLLKYLSDVNKEPYARSEAFIDAATVGVGWLEDGLRDDDTGEPLYVAHESWRNVWWDPLCRDKDIAAKARYLFRSRWVDLDYALAMFPDREQQLRSAAEQLSAYQVVEYDDLESLDAQEAEWYGFEPGFDQSNVEFRRPRVRLIEAWYREPARVGVLRAVTPQGKKAPYNGTIYNPQDPVQSWAVESGQCTLVQLPRLTVRHAIFVPGTLLHEGPSPYWHNLFPFTPIFCFRRGKDCMPFGVIRGARPIQEDLNKRRSKALHVLSNNRILMEQGAVDDIEELRDEADRPDGVIVYRPGKELKLDQDKQLAAQHVQLMAEDKAYIQEAVGITSENLGRETNATSGKAIIARQQQGHTIAGALFDSLRYALQTSGERKLALIEQFYDMEKTVRLVGERGKTVFEQINQPGVGNIITDTQADFVVDEEDFSATVRQAMFETMMEMVGKLPPDIGIRLLDLVVEFSDVPGRDEIVRRIREITGMQDPNAKPSEEELAMLQQQQQLEAAKQARVEAATMAALEGKAKEAQAKGRLAEMHALNAKLKGMQDSMGMAQQLAMTMPQVGKAADAIMRDAKTGN